MNIFKRLISHLQRPPCLVMLALISCAAYMSGCSGTGHDDAASPQNRPASIVVLPPINHTSDIAAGPALQFAVVEYLSKHGYDVTPIMQMQKTLHTNNIHNAKDAHRIRHEKLHAMFDVDAALYIEIQKYGAKFFRLGTNIEVHAKAKLFDLRSGRLLWQGRFNSITPKNTGALVALIEQRVNAVPDATCDMTCFDIGTPPTALLA